MKYYKDPKGNVYAYAKDGSQDHLIKSGLTQIQSNKVQSLVDSKQQAEFDKAIQRGVDTVISKAKGFEGYKINRGIESPERYVLQIFWTTLENHTVDFRESAAFAEWRAIVGPFFAQAPVVEHFELVTKSHS